MSGLKKKELHKDEHGLISIIVVITLTIILSLVAIGFSKLADRELRQASEREASAQAYYAAQSGINDAKAYLAAGNRANITGCTPQAAVSSYFSQDLSSGTGVAKYSCISVDTTPQGLSTTVTPGKPQLLKVHAPGLKNLFIAWENSSYTPGGPKWLSGSGKLPPEDVAPAVTTDTTGVLRVGLYDVPAGSTNNDALSNLSRVYYLYPSAGPGTIICPGAACADYIAGAYDITTTGPSGNNGSFIYGNCNISKTNPGGSTVADTHFCNSEIQNLPSTTDTYYLYLTAQYAPLSVSIQGKGGGGANVNFDGSQATVDVTGQGAGIIQRIRATINIDSQFDLPNYAIQSMESICKNFSIDVTGGVYGPAHPGIENFDNACSTPVGGGPIRSLPTDTKGH